MNWLLSSIYETNYARVQLFLKLPTSSASASSGQTREHQQASLSYACESDPKFGQVCVDCQLLVFQLANN